jgi:hypothetical protein
MHELACGAQSLTIRGARHLARFTFAHVQFSERNLYSRVQHCEKFRKSLKDFSFPTSYCFQIQKLLSDVRDLILTRFSARRTVRSAAQNESY